MHKNVRIFGLCRFIQMVIYFRFLKCLSLDTRPKPREEDVFSDWSGLTQMWLITGFFSLPCQTWSCRPRPGRRRTYYPCPAKTRTVNDGCWNCWQPTCWDWRWSQWASLNSHEDLRVPEKTDAQTERETDRDIHSHWYSTRTTTNHKHWPTTSNHTYLTRLACLYHYPTDDNCLYNI